MPEITLVPYAFSVKSTKGGKLVEIGSESTADLLDVLTSYLELRSKKKARDSDRKQLLSVKSFSSRGRTVKGLFDKGDYGWTSIIHDVDADKPTHPKKTHEAELLPFYFLFFVPESGHRAYAIFQKFGNKGVVQAFSRDLGDHFAKVRTDMKLHLNPLAEAGAVGRYIREGEIKQIRYQRKVKLSDLSDKVSGKEKQQSGYLELKIVAYRDSMLPFRREVLTYMKERENPELLELISDYSFEPERVKVEVERNGRTRTFSLDALDAQPKLDITERVTQRGGHPTFDSIDGIASDWMRELVAD